ncbi:MAG: inositol monophosphatase family protein, partial [Paracoccaceae bacterium]
EDDSPVTHADKSIEKLVRQTIAERHQTHGILGEEHGLKSSNQDEMWVVDPIDGTRSFISGHPLFGFLLAYLHKGVPEVGVIAMPMLNEVMIGVRGQGSTMNGSSMQVSQVNALEDAVVYINEGEKIFADHPSILSRLMSAGQTRRFSYDCYPYALLAMGHVDIVVDYDLKPYDFMALRVVIEAAGGILTDWNGERPGLAYEGPILAAATPELHQAMGTVLMGDLS